ncbi:MAG: LON peptidase substrate-binding domain-containing protein [Gammaproteobacteria bacterium]|nr:LON peptidase substrate-binding domain-containing protein [Gammaproteobacteria bacterium]
MKHCPLFPLNMTLFPGGRIPLQIFEARYIDLVKSCMKAEQGFIVISIKDGHESGNRPELYNIGTYAEIVDWELLPSGLLGITVEGRQRFILSDITEAKDKLLSASVEPIAAEDSHSVPDEYRHLVDILKSLKTNPVIQSLNLNIDYQSATDVSSRLCELLPFNIEDKQSLLELHDPLERLVRVQAILDIMGSDFNIR